MIQPIRLSENGCFPQSLHLPVRGRTQTGQAKIITLLVDSIVPGEETQNAEAEKSVFDLAQTTARRNKF